MKAKVDIVSFTLNRVFLIDQKKKKKKKNDCEEEIYAHGVLFFFDLITIFSPFLHFFSSFPLPFFPSLPLFRRGLDQSASFCKHKGCLSGKIPIKIMKNFSSSFGVLFAQISVVFS